jgi:hypothetical protein
MEQMEHLKLALGESIARPEYGSFLGDEALSLRRGLVQLQVINHYYAEALDTLRLMSLKGDEEGTEIFREFAEQPDILRTDDQQYGVAGRLGDNGSWNIKLLKSDFYLDDLSGRVQEVKLRCQGSFVFFEFDPEIQYHVADRAGECSLELVGDAGTSFTLVQG